MAQSSNDKWKLVTRYGVNEYACGLQAGDVVHLLKDIHVTSSSGPTGEIHRAGEEWLVLSGSTDDPGVVWLRQPDGHRHTWDDGPAIFEWFRVVRHVELQPPPAGE